MNDTSGNIPDIVFIVPYRDRQPHRFAFTSIMKTIVEDMNCKIIFAHQKDRRPFNRGAMKNAGFIYIKNTYPEHYKNITFVFHDIDVMPWYKGQFSYQTRMGIVNHFYGFKRGLGGIFAIKGKDFEDVNGFPNYWSWGLEDNVLKWRVNTLIKKFNYTEFVNHTEDNKNIIALNHGWQRKINDKLEFRARYRMDKMIEGIKTLSKVNYIPIDIDNIFIELNVNNFETGDNPNSPYIKNVNSKDVRFNTRLNNYDKKISIKRGAAGHFGKKRGFGGMVM
jgi:hypothetical protein